MIELYSIWGCALRAHATCSTCCECRKSCFARKHLCLGSDSAAGANVCACAAINTYVRIDRIVLALRDSAHRAFVFTCTACNAVVRNFVSHNVII